jgi:DnaJ-domain-containing protein 1
MNIFEYDLISIALIFFMGMFGYYISRIAENIILRILAVLFGLAIIADGSKLDNVVYLAFGTGMLLAHLKYFVMYIIGVIKSILAVTYDLYTFGLTIYYKTRNVFIGIYNTYQKIANFFRNRGKSRDSYRSDDNSEQNNYYEKQEYQNFYQDDTNNQSNQNYQEQKEDNYSHNYSNENNSSYEDDYFKNKQKEYSSNQNNSQQENKQEQKQEKKQQSNYDSKQEDTKQKQSSNSSSTKSNNPYGEEYNQFFSESMYTRLGLEYGADKKAIKKAYRKLVKEYHPDNHFQENDLKKYTEILQQINEAYEKIG